MSSRLNITRKQLIDQIQHNVHFRHFVAKNCKEKNSRSIWEYRAAVKRREEALIEIPVMEKELEKLRNDLNRINADKAPIHKRNPKVWETFKSKLGDNKLFNKLKEAKWPPLSKLSNYSILLCNRERRAYSEARAEFFGFEQKDSWNNRHEAAVRSLKEQISRVERDLNTARNGAREVPPIRWAHPDYEVDFSDYVVLRALRDMKLIDCDTVVGWAFCSQFGNDYVRIDHRIRCIDEDIPVSIRVSDDEDEDEEE